MADTAQLRLGDQTIELPIVEGSEGERALTQGHQVVLDVEPVSRRGGRHVAPRHAGPHRPEFFGLIIAQSVQVHGLAGEVQTCP